MTKRLPVRMLSYLCNARNSVFSGPLQIASFSKDDKGYFVKRDWPYFWPFFLLKREKRIFIFVERENAN